MAWDRGNEECSWNAPASAEQPSLSCVPESASARGGAMASTEGTTPGLAQGLLR